MIYYHSWSHVRTAVLSFNTGSLKSSHYEAITTAEFFYLIYGDKNTKTVTLCSNQNTRSPNSYGLPHFSLLLSEADILTDQICRANDLQWLVINFFVPIFFHFYTFSFFFLAFSSVEVDYKPLVLCVLPTVTQFTKCNYLFFFLILKLLLRNRLLVVAIFLLS